MTVRILVTGGTLDKDYDAVEGTLSFPGTTLPEMLAQSRISLPHSVEVLMQKDSLEMTDTDRQRIRQACEQAPESRLLITHGTDTMVDTARVLAQSPALQTRTIVLTGAMRPFRLGKSDALFNLGAALMAAQLAQPGVWLCMQGELFPWNQVRKNRPAGRFEWNMSSEH